MVEMVERLSEGTNRIIEPMPVAHDMLALEV
jgi:hypothetical protein